MKLGIIGCGRVVEEAHIPALRSLGEPFRVVAVCDPNPERRAAVSSAASPAFSPAEFDDWRAMLRSADIDTAVVAVPHDLHETAIIDALDAGVDVLSEKPVAPTLAAHDRIAAAARDRGARFGVMHNWQFNPEIVSALNSITEGRIGEPFLVRNEAVWGAPWASGDKTSANWRLVRSRSGGGIVLDGAYHAIYVAERALSAAVSTVLSSFGTNGPGDVEDTASVVLVHAGGATTVIQRCWASTGGGIGVHEIHGTSGSIRFPQPNADVLTHIFSGDYAAAAELDDSSRTRSSVDICDRASGGWKPLNANHRPSNWWDGIKEVYRLTAEAWAAGDEAPVPLSAARHVMAVIEAAYLSAARGSAINVAEIEAADASYERRPAA